MRETKITLSSNALGRFPSDATIFRMTLVGLLFLLYGAAAPGVGAEPLRLPDEFPIQMVFGGFQGHHGDDLTKRLEKADPYPVIHAPGITEQCLAARQRWPKKIITIQDAYGGSMSVDLAEIWPGHCLYKPGVKLSRNCAANDTVIYVDNPGGIATTQKAVEQANAKFPYYLTLYALDAQDKPDWSQAEHIQIIGLKGGQLTVKRGLLKTKPLSLKAGKAVVAAHMMFWGGQWQFNFSLQCPRGGPENLTATEWFAHKIADRVMETKTDGVEFDVGRWTWGNPDKLPMDCDNDLAADYGYIDGVNSFGLGGRVFFRELRRRLGPDKIIQVDSNNAIYGIRGWKYLNGVQLECFPAENDYTRFSEVFLHLRRWCEKAEALPRFSYGFTKAPTTSFGKNHLPDGSPTDFRFRIGLASDCMVGMPHPFANVNAVEFDPANDTNKKTTVENKGIFKWDEYYGGDLNDWQWLGRPLGPATQDTSALSRMNLLEKTQWQWKTDKGFVAECSANEGAFSANVKHLPQNFMPSMALWFAVRLEPVAGTAPVLTPGKEYTIEFEARGNDRWDYAGQIFGEVPRSIILTGMYEHTDRKPMSVFVESQWQPYRLSFVASKDAPTGPLFGVSEQIGDTAIRNIRLYEGGGERWRREFEHGLVLLNMTITPWKTPLPDGMYRRLKGTQAPEINTGQQAGSEIVTPPGDAVFLVRNK